MSSMRQAARLFVNPGGRLFEVLLVDTPAWDVALVDGEPELEHTWFEGKTWQFLSCVCGKAKHRDKDAKYQREWNDGSISFIYLEHKRFVNESLFSIEFRPYLLSLEHLRQALEEHWHPDTTAP